MVFRLKLVPAETNIAFMRWRTPALIASVFCICLSIVAIIVPGLNFGIDFRGGILIEVKLEKAVDIGTMRRQLGTLGLGEISIQEFGSPDTVLLRVEKQSGDSVAQQKAVEVVRSSIDETFDGKIDYRRVEFVGPKVSQELIEAGAFAVFLAVILMLGYIWFRFEWHFGIGAVVALIHDVILSIGMFAVTQMEFNLSTIAALLTIVGYSINDTVVVYDRVRENLRRYKSMPLPNLLDRTINDTLSRTTMTSATTLLALIALVIFGGEVIKGFVIAMMWGVVIGTYSSIFIAGPLLIYLGLSKQRGNDGDFSNIQKEKS